ncbi:unnamed protein product [Candidula unifasciata]|uniref:Secreted protein n=1 Tax=Candidula unifasciata TaxID=100452 RepID=A0A8S3ZW05_9EUPU|nr:unnamed protein product [Candidula unifasciata]
MRSVLILVLYWSAVVQTTAEELSKNVLDFLTYATGDFDNKVQVHLKGQEYDLIQSRARRVHVPSLEPNITLFIEQATSGVIKFFNLGIVTEGPGNTVSMKLYNFTDYSDIKFGSYDLDKISQVKPEQLQSDDKCVASFEIWGKGLMVAVYPNCRYTENGEHPNMLITYACDFVTVTYPPNTGQKHTAAPYVFQHKSTGEPLEGAPNDYISPCDN